MVETAKAVLLQPFADNMPGERLTPAALGAHPAPDRRRRQQDARRCERKENPRLKPERLYVAALEGIEKVPVPQIEQHLHKQLQENNADKEDDENRGPRNVFPPKAGGRSPEARQQLPLVEIRGEQKSDRVHIFYFREYANTRYTSAAYQAIFFTS
jgi:hypothetical protein